MKILIADDEPLARKRLQSLLEESEGDFEIVAQLGDGNAVIETCREHTVDLALLDIRMPGMDGIAAALTLNQEKNPPAIVFVTAYDEHALAAFDANAIDYLLKPIRQDRLQKALQKASVLTQAQANALSIPDQAATLSVSYRGAIKRIPIDEVIYLHADSKYVEVGYEGGIALLEASLKSVEEQHPERFLRVHRNALVDPQRIQELGKDEQGQPAIRLFGTQTSLLVSRRHLAVVRSLIRN